MLSRIYTEFRCFLREARYLATFLNSADKCALLFASVMLIGVFLPWVSAKGFFTQTGLMGGGDVHLVLAIITFYLAHKVISCQLKMLRKKNHHVASCLRRISLYYMLIGVSSTVSAIFILVYFSSQYAIINGIVDIRFGFYVTIFSGLLIFFCGLERFIR
jgi:hypothetical protein